MKIQEEDVSPYLKDVAKTHPLSREEEVELAEKIRKGDLRARNELITANLRYVITVAREYQNQDLPLADLISAGNSGLITAADRFNPDMGFKFISYAVWWIRQEIRKALSEEPRTVRISLNRLENHQKVEKSLRLKIQQHPERSEDDLREESAEELGINSSLLVGVGQRVRSLDAYINYDKKDTYLDFLLRSNEPSPEQIQDHQDLRETIYKALDALDEREKKVIIDYFGLNEEGAKTLEEIASGYGITRERVRQIKDKALRKIGHPRRSMELRAYHQEG